MRARRCRMREAGGRYSRQAEKAGRWCRLVKRSARCRQCGNEAGKAYASNHNCPAWKNRPREVARPVPAGRNM